MKSCTSLQTTATDFLVDLLLDHGPELHIPGQLLGASIQQRNSPIGSRESKI